MSQDTAAISSDLPGSTSDRTQSGFYLYLSLWMWVLAIVGFGPGYGSALVDGSWTRSIPVHLHAVIYVGWLALYTYQVSLPARARLARHRRLGQMLVGYAGLMIVVGLVVTFSRFADRVAANELVAAQQALIHPLSDMFIFPVLFGLAVYFRRSPETHKRLMVMATTYLLVAAVGRMSFLPSNNLIYDFVWLSPIWFAMIPDAFVYRILHPTYAIGLLALGVVPYRGTFVDTPVYQDLTRWLASVVSVTLS